jgi:hypothetical protein
VCTEAQLQRETRLKDTLSCGGSYSSRGREHGVFVFSKVDDLQRDSFMIQKNGGLIAHTQTQTADARTNVCVTSACCRFL